MNTHDHDYDDRTVDQRDDADLTPALRDGLRALRTDDAPPTDLWAGIAARLTRTAHDAGANANDAADTIDATRGAARSDAASDAMHRHRIDAQPPASARPAAAGGRRARRATRRAWTLPVAIAASIAFALAVGWQLQRPAADGAAGPAAPLIAHEANALTREYRAAFAAVDTRPLPSTEARTIAQLDRTAADVRAALKQAPESRLLLTQLKRIYARRLDLSQRFARMS